MMGLITSGMYMLLQVLPFGNWLLTNPFGMVYGTLIFDALSGLTLLLSKFVFKEYFFSKAGKRIFLLFVGGTALLTAAWYMFITIKTIPPMYTFMYPELSFSYLLPIYSALTLIAYIFFLVYLVLFILRLIRRGKQKTV